MNQVTPVSIPLVSEKKWEGVRKLFLSSQDNRQQLIMLLRLYLRFAKPVNQYKAKGKIGKTTLPNAAIIWKIP